MSFFAQGGLRMTIEFTVPGKPVPMARPRVTAHGTYTPKRCRDYKTAVALAAKAAMISKKPLEGAVVCRIELYFDVPKSYTKGKRLAAQHNVIKPVGKNTGDADNHAKAILDALKGICWADDSQVTRLIVEKRFTDTGDKAKVWICEDDKHD
jgi:Holliday junction resolvase RusA-like endonuclease